MSKSTKALLYNFVCFAILYMGVYFLIAEFTELQGLWKPITAAVAASLLAPKFQTVRSAGSEKIYIKWLFMKGVKEVK